MTRNDSRTTERSDTPLCYTYFCPGCSLLIWRSEAVKDGRSYCCEAGRYMTMRLLSCDYSGKEMG